MLYKYLIDHDLKFTPYINRLYSLIYYIECIRLCIYNKSIQDFLNDITYENLNSIALGCTAGLSQGGQALIERWGKTNNIKPNFESYNNNMIDNNAIKIFDYLYNYNSKSSNSKIEENYYIQGINGNLDSIIS